MQNTNYLKSEIKGDRKQKSRPRGDRKGIYGWAVTREGQGRGCKRVKVQYVVDQFPKMKVIVICHKHRLTQKQRCSIGALFFPFQNYELWMRVQSLPEVHLGEQPWGARGTAGKWSLACMGCPVARAGSTEGSGPWCLPSSPLTASELRGWLILGASPVLNSVWERGQSILSHLLCPSGKQGKGRRPRERLWQLNDFEWKSLLHRVF